MMYREGHSTSSSFESAVKEIEDASFIHGDQHVFEALSYGALLGKLKRKRLEDA